MGVGGIEPPTTRASVECSPTELHSHAKSKIKEVLKVFDKIGNRKKKALKVRFACDD